MHVISYSADHHDIAKTLFSFCVFLLAVIIAAAAEAEDNYNYDTKGAAVMAFGDSFLDTGNNNNLLTAIKCNFPPYGRDFMHAIPTGRFCNGRILSDFIAEALGVKKLLPSYLNTQLHTEDLLTGVSFASGGSGYDPLTSQIFKVLSLSDQLEFFKEYITKLRGIVGEERTKTIIATSTYIVSAGNNDIAFTYFISKLRKLHYDVPSYTQLLVSWASNFLKELHALGARRIAILNAAPLGCLPIVETLEGMQSANQNMINEATELFNAKLSSHLHSLNYQLPNAIFVYVDFYKPFTISSKTQTNTFSGFEIVSKGCCGTGRIELAIVCNEWNPFTCTNTSSYLFWDSAHLTEKAYNIIASQLLAYFRY